MKTVEYIHDGANVYEFFDNGEEGLVLQCESEDIAKKTASELNQKLFDSQRANKKTST